MKCNQGVNLFCSHFQCKKSTVSATNISSGWINSRFTCYFCCCLQHKKSTLVISKTECNWHSAELTLPCAAAAAVMLLEVSGWSALCEIPWRLSRWLERLVVFFTWLYIFYKQRVTKLEHLRLCRSQSVSAHTHRLLCHLPCCVLLLFWDWHCCRHVPMMSQTGRLNRVTFNVSILLKVLKKNTSLMFAVL